MAVVNDEEGIEWRSGKRQPQTTRFGQRLTGQMRLDWITEPPPDMGQAYFLWTYRLRNTREYPPELLQEWVTEGKTLLEMLRMELDSIPLEEPGNLRWEPGMRRWLKLSGKLWAVQERLRYGTEPVLSRSHMDMAEDAGCTSAPMPRPPVSIEVAAPDPFQWE